MAVQLDVLVLAAVPEPARHVGEQLADPVVDPVHRLDGGAPAPDAWRLTLDPAKPLPVAAVKVGEEDIPALIDTGAPTCNLDIGIIDAPAGALVARSLAFDGRVATAQFRVKDLAPIRRALGCRAVLGHNFLNGRRLRYIRDASTFFLD